MVSECFLQYCLTVRNAQIMQASEGLGFRYHAYSVVFEHSSSAYQEKVLTTIYRVVIYHCTTFCLQFLLLELMHSVKIMKIRQARHEKGRILFCSSQTSL